MLAYAAGDAAAFDALYARHKGGVYRYVLRHCGHAGVADELFQDVWMNVIRARASYAPTARFTTWLYRIAHNRVIDHWRATGHVELVTAGPDDDDDDPLDAIPGRAWRRARGPRRRTRDVGRASGRPSPRSPPRSAKRSCCTRRAGSNSRKSPRLTGAGVETVKSRIRYAVTKLRAELGRPAMTTPGPRDPATLSDPRVDAAWRAAFAAKNRRHPSTRRFSRRRGARSAPSRSEAAARETVADRRRWWPLAAAATIAAIVVGVLQLTTPDQLGAPPSDKAIVTDMPTARRDAGAGGADHRATGECAEARGRQNIPLRTRAATRRFATPDVDARRARAGPAGGGDRQRLPLAEPFPAAAGSPASQEIGAAAPAAQGAAPARPEEAPPPPALAGSAAAERALPPPDAAASADDCRHPRAGVGTAAALSAQRAAANASAPATTARQESHRTRRRCWRRRDARQGPGAVAGRGMDRAHPAAARRGQVHGRRAGARRVSSRARRSREAAAARSARLAAAGR